MLTRKQIILAVAIIAFNASFAVAAWYLLVGSRLFTVSSVIAVETLVLWLLYRRSARDPVRFQTPIPPREGTSRSGRATVEAFFRVRDDVRERLKN